jgi:transposase-like protein
MGVVRQSLNFVGWKHSRDDASDLRLVYTGSTADAALSQLTQFKARWDTSWPQLVSPRGEIDHVWRHYLISRQTFSK